MSVATAMKTRKEQRIGGGGAKLFSPFQAFRYSFNMILLLWFY
jgi:hypothetical protein